MEIAVDISLYPLTEGYLPPIKDLIERLGSDPRVRIEYNALSTQLRGDFDVVFDLLRRELRRTYEGADRAVVVMKMLGGPIPPQAAR
jgi:uncharacterized protein YqgV (UPF0045/DUF77 family)